MKEVSIKQRLELGQRMVSKEQASAVCVNDCFKDGQEWVYCNPCLNALFHRGELEILSEEDINEICNRKLTLEDAEGVCDSRDLCFEYNADTYVRCGPCSLRRYHQHGK